MDITRILSLQTSSDQGSSDKMVLYTSDLDTEVYSQPVQLSVPVSEDIKPHYCALGELANKIKSPSDLSLHSKKHRKALFLNWVAYERLHDEGILRCERFTCPLIWCREPFHEARNFLDHVKICNKLENGEYYCAEHATNERFIFQSANIPTLNIKLSVIVSRAIRIIRKLGSKRSRRRYVTPELDGVLVSPPGWEAEYFLLKAQNPVYSRFTEAGFTGHALECFELSPTRSQYLPNTHSHCYELSTSTTTFTEPVPYSESKRSLDDGPGQANQELDVLESVTDAMDVDTRIGTDPGSARSRLSVSSSFDVISSESTTPLSSCFLSPAISETSMAHASQYPREGSETQLTPATPMSTTLANSDQEHGSATFCRNSWVTISPQMSCFDDDMISELANMDRVSPVAPPRKMSEDFSDKVVCAVDYDAELHRKASGNKMPMQFKVAEQSLEVCSQISLVEGLRQVSELLYTRSIRNLKRNPVPYDIQQFIYEMPPIEHIAEKGLSILWKVFSGHLPSTLVDVYAMIHVAYVLAIVINQKEVVEVLDDLYADIYNWSLAIKSDAERALFVDIACRIWAVEKGNTKCPRDAIGGFSGTPNQPSFATVLAPINRPPLLNTFKSTRSEAFDLGIGSAKCDALLHVLKGGTVIYLCRQYLDILEYTGLLASDRGRHLGQMQGCIESMPPSEDMMTSLYWGEAVIEPLIKFIGLEGFRPVVNNVQKLIDSGVFHNFREVELKLIYDAQHCSRSAARYHSFLKEVQRLCKEASTFPLHAPFPHDTQYRTDIDITRRFLDALNQKKCLLDVSSPQSTTCSNHRNRMTNKDLPPIVTEETVAMYEDLPKTPITPMNNRIVSSALSTAYSTASASSSNLVSGSSGRSIFSGSTAVSSNSSMSFINSSPESHDRNAFQSSPLKRTFQSPRLLQRRAARSRDATQPVTPCPRPDCDEVFTGTSQKTNCSRHVNTVHSAKRYHCPDERCDQSFSRSDNLGPHKKKVHKKELHH